MSVVLPGEVIQTQHKTLKLGPGLQQLVDLQGRTSTVVTRAGTLEQNAKGNKFWVEGNSRRVSLVTIPAVDPCNNLAKYVPAAQEPVIGVVSARQGEGWRVDIGSAHQASLDGLAFEGASRRNRPNLKVRHTYYSPQIARLISIR
jgi:exosome complex component RRP40